MDMLSQSQKSNVPNLDRQMVKYAAAMQHCGWNGARIERVLGKNWVRLLGDVWG
jgi:microsomal dipeptidase-like Zn-dependent dipeptidase